MGKSKDLATGASYQDQTESDARYVNVSGDTMTAPLEILDASTGGALVLGSGDNSTAAGGWPQIKLGYSSSEDYPSFISTRHNAGTRDNNTIEFHLGDGTQSGVLGTDTRQVLRLEGNGYVTMPYQPAFLVYSSGTNSIPNSAGTTVVLNNKVSDRGNHFNISTYTYTVPVSGFYHFDATVSYSGSFTAARIIAYIVVNGSDNISRQTYRAGLDTGVSVSGSLYLSANDTVTVRTYQDSGSSRNLLTGLQWTHFSGYLIG